MIHVVVPVTVLPHPDHTVRALNVVSYELLRNLAKERDMDISVLLVKTNDNSPSVEPNNSKAMRTLERAGIACLPPMSVAELKPPSAGKRDLLHQLFGSQNCLIPATRYTEVARKRIGEVAPDVLLTIWSEVLTAMFLNCELPKVAYYGNPDPVNRRARDVLTKRFTPLPPLKSFVLNLVMRQFESRHLALMSRWDTILDVASNGAEYYRAHGHPNSKYLRNTWIDRLGWEKIAQRPVWRPDHIVRIICNVGRPAGTANTFGLLWLVEELLPELRNVFADRQFELHVLGAGEPDSRIANFLNQSEIVIRGFVDDIDAELMANPLFLCVNNATEYNVGHTRYLHAWTLGCCVIAHANVSLAMPELVHGKNALLGADAHAIALQLKRATDDPSLVRKLGDAGFSTFVQLFAPDRVAADLAMILRATVTSATENAG